VSSIAAISSTNASSSTSGGMNTCRMPSRGSTQIAVRTTPRADFSGASAASAASDSTSSSCPRGASPMFCMRSAPREGSGPRGANGSISKV
jgi:hypothetical protein